MRYRKHPVVEATFSRFRPVVVGLLVSVALVPTNVENFDSPIGDIYTFVISIIILLAAFVGTKKYNANLILVIIAYEITGLVLY